MPISQEQFRKLFTQALVAVYKERARPTGFLRSFFRNQTNMTKYISIEVQRGTEKIAADVARAASDGNLNRMTKSTMKIIEAPLYWEYINATDHRLYDVAIGTQDRNSFRQLVRELADELVKSREKIERAYELQCAEVLLDGIVQLVSGDSIDYKRKAASMVDVTSSNNWTTASNDPRKQLEDAGEFLRQEGKVQGGYLNAIMGDNAFNAFMNSDVIRQYGDLRRVDLMSINRPQRNAQGGVLHGELPAGPYNIRIWSYPEYYEDSQGNHQPYLNKDKVVVLPDQPNFLMNFAAVPQLLGPNGEVPQRGAYHTFDYMNERSAAHEIHTKSAGIALPVAVDQIFTALVTS